MHLALGYSPVACPFVLYSTFSHGQNHMTEGIHMFEVTFHWRKHGVEPLMNVFVGESMVWKLRENLNGDLSENIIRTHVGMLTPPV
jgi:hypothetical protein